VSAGQVWRRRDGLLWTEVQTDAVEPSGWRLMVPLVEAEQAVAAPPLVVALGRWHARVHLLTGVPEAALGELIGTLPVHQIGQLREAVTVLITPSH
jgi:hypothetical protein